MYTVIAENHVQTVKFEENYLEKSYAVQMFNVACKCVDCAYAMLLDACTGEVLADYSGVSHEVTIF